MPSFDSAARHFRTCLTAGLAALLAAPCAWAGAALPATPEAWRAAATNDIEAAVRVTRENHPGVHDPRNPGFLANLEAARKHGLALASQVTSAPGYVAALGGFNVRIGDGHAGAFPTLNQAVRPKERWPGFVSVWRGDALYVFAAHDGQPAAGSKLLACDGKTAQQLIKDNVFSFSGRSAEAGQWRHARWLFVDAHNPFIELPQRCSFQANGRVIEHRLVWRDLDEQADRWLVDSNDGGDARPVGMSEPRKNLFWVSMPTFEPNEDERAAYRAVNREIEQNRARYLAADALVVDLRKNQGGSSSWSADFAKALWGKERVARARADYSANTETWWRASPGNTDYVLSIANDWIKKGNPDMAAWARTNAEGMRGALARGEPFYVQKKTPPAPAGAGSEVAPFTRPLYVVVPGNCASACLDAVDVFSLFPNTRLVGSPSSADSTYMEVRFENLPSGLATVIIPNKVYVNRPRANGQVVHPKLPVLDVVWSMQALLKAMESDLERR